MIVKMEKQKQRIEFLDLLRIISAFAVVLLHVAAQNWKKVPVMSIEWNVFNIYDSMVRWAVPVFVMISGAIFLSREIDIKKLYKKNILRLVIAFIFWSLIYICTLKRNVPTIKNITNFLCGHYHMWYIIMILGIYILLPVLKKISESKKITKYYIIITFVIWGVIPLLLKLMMEIDVKSIQTIANALNQNYSKLNLSLGYTGYFLLGWYINENEITKKWRKIIYVLGVFGVIATILLTRGSSYSAKHAVTTYYNNFYINVALEAVALFVLAKYNFRSNNFIKQISNCCFGVYLIHVLIIEGLNAKLSLNTLSFNAFVSVPVLAGIVFIISVIVSYILKKIPILNKYIV